jgi:hypothetical protein
VSEKWDAREREIREEDRKKDSREKEKLFSGECRTNEISQNE